MWKSIVRLWTLFHTIYHSLTSELAHLSLTQALDAYHGVKFQAHRDRGGIRPKIRAACWRSRSFITGVGGRHPGVCQGGSNHWNFYTHHNPEVQKTGRVAKGAALIRLNEKLTLLFQMCVLADMGIPADRFPDLRRQLATEIVHMG